MKGKRSMTSVEAKHELIRTLDIVKFIIKEEIDSDSEINYEEWFKNLDELVLSNINGLKRLCFDNGEIHLFQKMSDEILGYWKKIKTEAMEIS